MKHLTATVVSCLLVIALNAQLTPVDSALIKEEQVKWESLKTGNFSLSKPWFRDDFFNIGYMPDGSVYRAYKNTPKEKTAFADNQPLPTADFKLSEFMVINASPDVKIVTYKAEGPFHLYISTTWSKSSGEWKSVFYQATRFDK